MSYDDLQLNVPYFVQYDDPDEWFIDVYTNKTNSSLEGICVKGFNDMCTGDYTLVNATHWQSVTVCKPLSGPIDALQENYPELFL